MMRSMDSYTFFDPDTDLSDQPEDHIEVADINRVKWQWF